MRLAATLSWMPLVAVLVVPAEATRAPGVTWQGWNRGLDEARRTGRPVLVDVYTDWCGWCRRMEAEVYSRPEIREYLSTRFVAVRINAEASDAARYEGRAFTSRTLAARFGVSGYPTTVFLRPDGQHLVNVPGYMGGERFLQVLRYIAEGHMERGVSFRDFTRQSAPPAR